MRCVILFFGQVRDAAGASQIEVALPTEVRDVPSLLDWMSATNDRLALALRKPGIRVAIDRVFAPADAHFERANEIAIMSPLSGG